MFSQTNTELGKINGKPVTNVMKRVLLEFQNLISTIYEDYYSSWGDSHVAVLSIRPNLNFKNTILSDYDYNHRQQTLTLLKKEKEVKEMKNRKKLIRELNDNNKYGIKVKNRRNNVKETIDYNVYNKFAELSKLEEKCYEFNGNTESNITPAICVEKIVSIKNKKYVHNLNINEIVNQDHVIINIELKQDTNEVEEDKKNKNAELNENSKDFYDKLAKLMTEFNEQKKTSLNMEHKRICTQLKDIKKLFEANKRVLRTKVDNICETINPDKEANACKLMGLIIPKPITPIIQDLIGKSAVGCHELKRMCDSTIRLLDNLFERMFKGLLDLD
jgi:hypothetical protein